MRFAQAAFSFLFANPLNWRADWACGLPLVVLTVVIHAIGLGLISRRVIRVTNSAIERHRPTYEFVLVVGVTTLLGSVLHGLEAGLWAIAYRLLGAQPDNRSAMLYSLNAMTSYGHESLSLEAHWQLMGAIEALNGWLLFGLTTAFLFGVIQRVWLSVDRARHR
jgi:hypothetical protein